MYVCTTKASVTLSYVERVACQIYGLNQRIKSYHVGTDVKHKSLPVSKGLKHYKIPSLQVLQGKTHLPGEPWLTHFSLTSLSLGVGDNSEESPSRLCWKEKAVFCVTCPLGLLVAKQRRLCPCSLQLQQLAAPREEDFNLPHQSPLVSGLPDCFCCCSLILQSCKAQCNNMTRKVVSNAARDKTAV